MEAVRGEDFEACFESGITGLVGIVSLMVIDNDGGVWYAASTADIIESPAGSGVYCANRSGIFVNGHYSLVWSTDGTYDETSVSIDDLFIVSAPSMGLPPLPPPASGGDYDGPCSAWTTSDAVLDCCDLDELDSMFDSSLLDPHVVAASEVLFKISGGLYSGECSRTVVACESECDCGYQVLDRGHVIGPWLWDGISWPKPCGCPPKVLLAGYPVRSIDAITLGGVLLDAADYELRDARYAVLRNGNRWPNCDTVCREEAEAENTITYSFGASPPVTGQLAAAALACEFYKACNNLECKLPTGAVRIVRQGVTVERLQPLATMLTSGQTGILAFDSFVAGLGKVTKRPIFWSSSGRKFARPLGA